MDESQKLTAKPAEADKPEELDGNLYNRPVTIAVFNLTPYSWKYESYKETHGTLTKRPPTVIEAGQSGVFCANTTLMGSYGPEGTLCYLMPNGVKVCIYWDHPVGPQDSAYNCYSIPPGKVRFHITPEHPRGHSQEVSLTVKLVEE